MIATCVNHLFSTIYVDKLNYHFILSSTPKLVYNRADMRLPIHTSAADAFIGEDILDISHTADGITELHRQIHELAVAIRDLGVEMKAMNARIEELESTWLVRLGRWFRALPGRIRRRYQSL